MSSLKYLLAQLSQLSLVTLGLLLKYIFVAICSAHPSKLEPLHRNKDLHKRSFKNQENNQEKLQKSQEYLYYRKNNLKTHPVQRKHQGNMEIADETSTFASCWSVQRICLKFERK